MEFYEIKLFRLTETAMRMRAALATQSTGAQPAASCRCLQPQARVTFSNDILRGGKGGTEYSIGNTAYIKKINFRIISNSFFLVIFVLQTKNMKFFFKFFFLVRCHYNVRSRIIFFSFFFSFFILISHLISMILSHN